MASFTRLARLHMFYVYNNTYRSGDALTLLDSYQKYNETWEPRFPKPLWVSSRGLLKLIWIFNCYQQYLFGGNAKQLFKATFIIRVWCRGGCMALPGVASRWTPPAALLQCCVIPIQLVLDVIVRKESCIRELCLCWIEPVIDWVIHVVYTP
jgi:hypothetical protein